MTESDDPGATDVETLESVLAVLDAMESAYPAGTGEFDGDHFIVNAAAASAPHGRAILAVANHLGSQLRPGHSFSTDTRIAFGSRVAAPDLIVADEAAIAAGSDSTAIDSEDVHLIVEVLSPSTRVNDLGWKLEAARHAGIDYWVIEPSDRIGAAWASVTSHRFGAGHPYSAP